MFRTLLLLFAIVFQLARHGSGGNHGNGGNGDGRGNDNGRTPGRTHGDTSSISSTQSTAQNNFRQGEPAGGPGNTSHTQPTLPPDPNRRPRGEPADVRDPNATPEEIRNMKNEKRQLYRENETADAMAQQGYDIEQNPPGRENGRNPDYKINGEYWDNYSPASGNVDQIRRHIRQKVEDANGNIQADRVTLNVTDSKVSLDEIKHNMQRKPIDGLKEIKVIDGNGNISDFYPF